MRVVWSFWSKPYVKHHYRTWSEEKYHLFSWILSVKTARLHYDDLILYTDNEGENLLCNVLMLPFTEVHLALNNLRTEDEHWWVLGKLYTYGLQDSPFVHIDSDVYLWRPLPSQVTAGPIFAQNPEYFNAEDWWYQPNEFARIIKSAGGWLPAEWTWYTSRRIRRAVCCGMLGANNIEFMKYYSTRAVKIISDTKNKSAAISCDQKRVFSILVEQYFLAACLAYYSYEKHAEFEKFSPVYLFQSAEEAFDPLAARQAGYTHLISGAKQDGDLLCRLEFRIKRDFPDHYARVMAYLS